MCMIDEAEEWDVFGDRERTARKEHRCGECRRTIKPGERYRYATGLYDGRWSAYKQCLQCVAASQWLMSVCSGYMFEFVEQELREHWEEDTVYRHRSFGRVIVHMKWKWRRGHGLVPVEQVKAWVSEALAGLPKAAAR